MGTRLRPFRGLHPALDVHDFQLKGQEVMRQKSHYLLNPAMLPSRRRALQCAIAAAQASPR